MTSFYNFEGIGYFEYIFMYLFYKFIVIYFIFMPNIYFINVIICRSEKTTSHV